MRRIISSTFVSLDGIMQAPGGPDEDRSGGFAHGGWTEPLVDASVSSWLDRTFADPFDLLLGRRTYEIFAAYWPHHTDSPVGAAFARAHKYVASQRLQDPAWGPATVLSGTVYLVVLIGLVCVYWDYLDGWPGWSLTYAVPALCACSLVALLITLRLLRTEVGEHILYSGLTVLLGLAPLVFLAAGWVSDPVPSLVCGMLSLGVLAVVHLGRIAELGHELAKRLHV